jgi:hypothetical protein
MTTMGMDTLLTLIRSASIFRKLFRPTSRIKEIVFHDSAGHPIVIDPEIHHHIVIRYEE